MIRDGLWRRRSSSWMLKDAHRRCQRKSSGGVLEMTVRSIFETSKVA